MPKLQLLNACASNWPALSAQLGTSKVNLPPLQAAAVMCTGRKRACLISADGPR